MNFFCRSYNLLIIHNLSSDASELDKTRLEISNSLSKIEPPITIDIQYIPLSREKYVIKMAAQPEITSKPYVFDGKPFWRVESSTRPMPQPHYQNLLMERVNRLAPWETSVTPYFTINDLDHDEIINTINEAIRRGRMDSKLATGDLKESLMRLKLLNNEKLTHASMVLFCRDPMPHYPQCLLRMVRFKGLDKSHMIDSKRIHGNVFKLLDEAEKFLIHHMSIQSKFLPGKMARVDYPDFAPRAVREAMVNAVCHRQYAQQGGSINLAIYEDRLEITSPGRLINGVHIDDLKRPHDSRSRNSVISQVMYKRGLIEAVGTGTQEIIKETKAIGKPEPEYVERGDTFVVIFKSKIMGDSEVRQNKIVELLRKHGKLQKSDIANRIELDVNERTLRRDLKQLEKMGIVQMVGNGRNTVWWLKEEDPIAGH